MILRIIVPLDGSPFSEAVLPYARHIAMATGARLDLVSIVEEPSEEMTVSFPQLRIKAAEDYLKKVAATFGGLEQVETDVLSGSPARGIITRALEQPSSIIAMSTHGRAGVTRWLIGSVAEKVVLNSKCPVFLVRPPKQPSAATPTLKSVIVPLDGSPASEEALPYAIELARALKLNMTIAKVTPDLRDFTKWDTFPGAVVTDYGTIVKELTESAAKYLDSVAAKIGQKGVAQVRKEVLHGNAAECIITLAQGTPDSFVAMTTRGMSGFSRAALGSVADRVVRHSARPVLVIPPAKL